MNVSRATTTFDTDCSLRAVDDRMAKMISLGVALLLHAIVVLILTLVVFASFRPEEPALISVASAPAVEKQVDRKVFDKRAHRRPSSASAPVANLISSATANPIALPTVEDTELSEVIGFGMSFGDGLGFGAGGRGTGKICFLGTQDTAARVAFVVDASLSMSQEHVRLMKDELMSSLKKLPSNLEYQVLWFAGPVWSAEEKVTEGVGRSRAGAITVVEARKGSGKHRWEQSGNARGYKYLGMGSKRTGDDEVAYPAYGWIKSDESNIRKSIKDVESFDYQHDRVFGTDWLVPLMTALKMDPKPGVIYFVTDGRTGRPDQIAEEIVREARSGKTKTKINTIGLLKPQQAEGLRMIAMGTKAKFKTIDNAGDGKRGRGKKTVEK